MRALFSTVARAVLPREGIASEAQLDAEAPLPSCSPVLAALLPARAGGARGFQGGEGSDDDEDVGPAAVKPINESGGLLTPPGAGASASLGGRGRSIARIVARAVAELTSRMSVREVLLRTPALDAALSTPYTVWAARFRLPEVMLGVSTAMLAYVFIDTVLQIAGVVGS